MKQDSENTPLSASAPATSYLTFDEDCTLHFAMRYALRRSTGAADIVVREIVRKWARIKPHTQAQMQSEIADELFGGASAQRNRDQWHKVLGLAVSDNEVAERRGEPDAERNGK